MKFSDFVLNNIILQRRYYVLYWNIDTYKQPINVPCAVRVYRGAARASRHAHKGASSIPWAGNLNRLLL